MQLKIFNVGHGFCAHIISDNNNNILIDCGHNIATGFTPTNYLKNLRVTDIGTLIISNFDEDHVADLKNIINNFPITEFCKNPSISAEQLRLMKQKSGVITPAMEATIQFYSGCSDENYIPPEYAGIELSYYWNDYPQFDDTNNLSLVSIIKYLDLAILFPGDLETKGWTKLLERTDFQDELKNINVFVASHHGRKNGVCTEVFEYCKPEIIIISDGPKEYQTQEFDYGPYAKGINLQYEGLRRVLTTRKDGTILIIADNKGNYMLKIKA